MEITGGGFWRTVWFGFTFLFVFHRIDQAGRCLLIDEQ
jgi:hypothetical protein